MLYLQTQGVEGDDGEVMIDDLCAELMAEEHGASGDRDQASLLPPLKRSLRYDDADDERPPPTRALRFRPLMSHDDAMLDPLDPDSELGLDWDATRGAFKPRAPIALVPVCNASHF